MRRTPDKLTEEDMAPVEEKASELEALIDTEDDLDEAIIQAKVEEVQEAMHAISAKLYEAAAANMEDEHNGSTDPTIIDDAEEIVDADFEVVEDE